MDPYFAPALIAHSQSRASNQRRNADAEAVACAKASSGAQEGSLHYSLGLLLAEEKHDTEAIVELQKAAELTPGQPRIRFTTSVCCNNSADS